MEKTRIVAYVRCRGGSCLVEDGNDGKRMCTYGCVGCRICEKVCYHGAISMTDQGVAVVDPEKCKGCRHCAVACPQNAIDLIDASANIRVTCKNKDEGKVARSVCVNSCIACGICEKNCPVGAIYIKSNRAVINQELCICCGMCAVKCPRGVIRDSYGIITE